MKPLDVIGIALILLGLLWAVVFPSPHYAHIGSYSIADLFPPILGAGGLICIIAARLRRGG